MSLPNLTGQTLINVDRDYTLRLDTREGWQVAIEGVELVDDKDLAAALYGAIDTPLTAFAIGDDGVLTLTVGEASVRAVPHAKYDSWNVSGPDTQLVVCTPGGELAIWD